MTGKLFIYCPEMPVLATALFWIRECQELPSTYKIEWDNGDVTEGNITFPKVKVRWQWKYGQWLVDKVPAKGPKLNPPFDIAVTMDKERVQRIDGDTMHALPVLAHGYYIDQSGKKWQIVPKTEADGSKTFFPVCKVEAVGWGWFKYVAEPVIAEGVVVG